MNSKTGILVVLAVLALLFAGVALLTHQPPTIITIVIPAWLRAGGAVIGMAGLVLWLRRDLWHLVDEPLSAIGSWLRDEEGA
jgi:hypothetical protein